eukprot:403376885
MKIAHENFQKQISHSIYIAERLKFQFQKRGVGEFERRGKRRSPYVYEDLEYLALIIIQQEVDGEKNWTSQSRISYCILPKFLYVLLAAIEQSDL